MSFATRFFDRVIALHPAVATVAFVAVIAAGGVGMNAFEFGGAAWTIAYSVTMFVIFALIMLWHYCLYRAASARSADFVGHRGRRAFLFVISSGATLVFLATFPARMGAETAHGFYPFINVLGGAALFVGCVTYFASIWAAANALTRFDEKQKSVDLHKTLGTFLLELYLPIGIWVIHSRIKRMLAAG